MITRSDPARVLATALFAFAFAFAFALFPTRARADAPAPAPAQSPAPTPAPDPLDPLRDRFRQGMDKYKSAAIADAIVIWESIYRELGADQGYRLAFNLARAYDELGDLIKAADYYESYLRHVDDRRREGATLEPNVARQEEVARERHDHIASVKSRIRVIASATRPVVATIDNTPPRVAGFVVYVEPGLHTVTFGVGVGARADVRSVTAPRGEIVDVAPREEQTASATPPSPAAPGTRPQQWKTRVERPFSPTVLWVAAGVAVASLAIPIVTYVNALSLKSEYDDASTPRRDKERLEREYDSASSNHYALITVPAVLGAAAGGLAAWYLLGGKETRVAVTPGASMSPGGASFSLSARF